MWYFLRFSKEGQLKVLPVFSPLRPSMIRGARSCNLSSGPDLFFCSHPRLHSFSRTVEVSWSHSVWYRPLEEWLCRLSAACPAWQIFWRQYGRCDHSKRGLDRAWHWDTWTGRPYFKGLVKSWNAKNSNSREPLMFSHKYYFCFRVVKKQIVTIQPAYDVS